MGDSITIGDLDIPEGVEPTLAADVLVAIVNESRVTKSADEEAGEESWSELLLEAAAAE